MGSCQSTSNNWSFDSFSDYLDSQVIHRRLSYLLSDKSRQEYILEGRNGRRLFIKLVTMLGLNKFFEWKRVDRIAIKIEVGFHEFSGELLFAVSKTKINLLLKYFSKRIIDVKKISKLFNN